MAFYALDEYHMAFPDPELADENGLIAVGGRISEDWLLLAYESGIFPWSAPDEPLLWWSPDPRCVLLPDEVRVHKSMGSVLNRPDWTFRMDTAFGEVVEQCSAVGTRKGNTWIDPQLKSAYGGLHRAGVGHSAEVWCEGRLIGGLFGVSLGAAFFGESMFSLEDNASKYALIHFCRWLSLRDFHFVDCQIPSPHLHRMGAKDIPRSEFLDLLHTALEEETYLGVWKP